MNRDLIAQNVEKLKEDHSCSQSTLMGICENENCSLDSKQLYVLGSGFAGGIGGTFDEGTCGALNGAVIALGLLENDPDLIKRHSKKLFEAFKDKYGSVECGIISKNGDDKSNCLGCCLFISNKVVDLLDKKEE